MIESSENYVKLESIFNLFYRPRALLRGRINRGVMGTPFTKVDLMRRRQKVEYAHYSRFPNPSDAVVLNMEELKTVEG